MDDVLWCIRSCPSLNIVNFCFTHLWNVPEKSCTEWLALGVQHECITWSHYTNFKFSSTCTCILVRPRAVSHLQCVIEFRASMYLSDGTSGWSSWHLYQYINTLWGMVILATGVPAASEPCRPGQITEKTTVHTMHAITRKLSAAMLSTVSQSITFNTKGNEWITYLASWVVLLGRARAASMSLVPWRISQDWAQKSLLRPILQEITSSVGGNYPRSRPKHRLSHENMRWCTVNQLKSSDLRTSHQGSANSLPTAMKFGTKVVKATKTWKLQEMT